MTSEEKLSTVLAEVDKILPPQSCIKLTPVRCDTTVFDSKLGGVPYLPQGFAYPVVKEGEFKGKPLKFLAQLNFSGLPHIKDFPETGILQFYCSCDGDDVIGLEYDPPFNQNCYRVIYHENIIYDEEQLISAVDMPDFIEEQDYIFPFIGEFLLKAAEPADMAVTYSDYRFDRTVTEVYNRVFASDMTSLRFSRQGKSICGIDREFADAVYKMREGTASLIGGYPSFTQFDPRGWKKHFSVCDTLLFQLESIVSGQQEIMWGDGGVGSFFISRGDLIRRDFSRVLYHWDCG